MNKFYKLVIETWVLFVSWVLGFGVLRAQATYDPLSVPNNRYGVHILDTNELTEAAKLVNSTNGDWGYVTIPLRSDDRDPDKWREFFIKAARLHAIPIIRLATYPDGGTWVTPNSYDLVDFANFLEDMPWPTQNRYIVLFNEPNHSNEWGSLLSPLTYATLILDAKDIFRSRSPDFFLLSAGLDMSSPNSSTSMDALEFYRRMTTFQPDWYSFVDGLSVHAYPNPGFSASPYSTSRFGITSFRYEQNYLSRFGFPQKPIFITETGSKSPINFFPIAFQNIWTDANIVAITPFVLFAGAGDFIPFSLLNTQSYTDIQKLPKIAGSPFLNTTVPSDHVPKLKIGDTELNVEISDTDQKRRQGLSGRATLSENTGMFFIFPSAGIHPFWMKDMLFPLDFIWIKENKVVQLDENIPPPSKTFGLPKIVTPKESIDKVLEVNAGFIAKHGIKVGDEVDFRP